FDEPIAANADGGDTTDIGAFEVQQSCNKPPVAKCKNVTVSAGSDCTATVSIDDGSFDPDAVDTIIITESPVGPYALGQTTVPLTVTDNHGASSQCQATVTVVDSTAPQLTCPQNQVLSANDHCQAVATYSASATDNCTVSPTVNCIPPSGSTFSTGTTTVTCQ